MYGYYILKSLNPAQLERQNSGNRARAAVLRARLERWFAPAASGTLDAIEFLKTRIRTSLLSRKRPLATFESDGR